jgi:hypothetical protein
MRKKLTLFFWVVFLICLASGLMALPKLELVLNGEKSEIPLQLAENRTLVPLRDFAEALGADVHWQAGTVYVDQQVKVEEKERGLWEIVFFNQGEKETLCLGKVADEWVIIEQVNYRVLTQLPVKVRQLVESTRGSKACKILPGEGSQYLLISLGKRNTGGYSIEIIDVKKIEEQVVVTYRERRPAPRDMVIQVITYPWIVVEIDSMLPIVVEEEKSFCL